MTDDTNTTTPEGRSFERSVGRLDPSKLHEIFCNVQAVPDDRFSVYRVIDMSAPDQLNAIREPQ